MPRRLEFNAVVVVVAVAVAIVVVVALVSVVLWEANNRDNRRLRYDEYV